MRRRSLIIHAISVLSFFILIGCYVAIAARSATDTTSSVPATPAAPRDQVPETPVARPTIEMINFVRHPNGGVHPVNITINKYGNIIYVGMYYSGRSGCSCGE